MPTLPPGCLSEKTGTLIQKPFYLSTPNAGAWSKALPLLPVHYPTPFKPCPSGKEASARVWAFRSSTESSFHAVGNTIYNLLFTVVIGLTVLVMLRCVLKLGDTLAVMQAWCDWIVAWAVYVGMGTMACTLLSVVAPIVSPISSILFTMFASQAPPAAALTAAAVQPFVPFFDPTFVSAGLVSLLSVFGCAYGANQDGGC